jgi:hypothetical protein
MWAPYGVWHRLTDLIGAVLAPSGTGAPVGSGSYPATVYQQFIGTDPSFVLYDIPGVKLTLTGGGMSTVSGTIWLSVLPTSPDTDRTVHVQFVADGTVLGELDITGSSSSNSGTTDSHAFGPFQILFATGIPHVIKACWSNNAGGKTAYSKNSTITVTQSSAQAGQAAANAAANIYAYKTFR